MMKWKARTETTNIGILELGNLTFDEDYMEVSIDICDMSDSLKAEVDKAIEIAKVQYTKENETLNAENGYHLPTVWSDKPVVMDFTYLRVVLEAGKPIKYTICIGFHDAVDEHMEQWNCDITVDLSEYANELKKAIIKDMEHGAFKSNIVVTQKGLLVDGYCNYIVAVVCGISSVQCEINTKYIRNHIDKKNGIIKNRSHKRKILYERQSGKCAICGMQLQIDDFTSIEDYLTLDHILPVSRGGSNGMKNLQGLCRRCNYQKQDEYKEDMEQ